MRTIYYSRSKLLRKSGFYLLPAALCAWFGGLLIAPALYFGVVGLAVAIWAFGDRTALIIAEEGVTVVAPEGRRTVRWEEVDEPCPLRRTMWLFGLLPIGSTPHLELSLGGDRSRGPAFPLKLLDLDHEQQVVLVKVLLFARAGGLDLIDPTTGELKAEATAPTPPVRSFGRRAA
jgi:hypothetical protein